VPAIIADLGEQAGWRYVEFFTANIRNPHTRRAYARACGQFFAWCDQRGLTLTAIRPHDVATYIEQLLAIEASAPLVKHQLAAVRMLFDWLVVGQIVPANPASAVRGPKHVVEPERIALGNLGHRDRKPAKAALQIFVQYGSGLRRRARR
jgi:site-specific recombinase XerD